MKRKIEGQFKAITTIYETEEKFGEKTVAMGTETEMSFEEKNFVFENTGRG